MAPVRAVGTVSVGTVGTVSVGTVEVGARWRRDNRPDFPGLAVWVDAVAEIEIATDCFEDFTEIREIQETREAGEARIQETAGADGLSQSSDEAYGLRWNPLAGTGREPRPGLLLSVVRAGEVVAYPTPMPDPPAGVLALALPRLEPAAEGRSDVLPVEAVPSQPRRTAPQKAYVEVRALVGVLIEILVGRRAAGHAARWTDPEVRRKLRIPRYSRAASLKSVRLAESGEGVEALALLQDSGRTRVVALRFERSEDSRWQCTALQAG